MTIREPTYHRMTDNTDPRTEYLRRIDERRAESARQFQRFRNVGFIRLASVAIGVILLWRVFAGLSAWWLVFPTVLFVALGRVQARISAARFRCDATQVHIRSDIKRASIAAPVAIGRGLAGSNSPQMLALR